MAVLRALSCLVLGTLVLAGCGRDGDRKGTQPAPATETFEQGVFDDLPQYPRSEALGPRTETDGTVAQSFRAEGATPEQVLEYYQSALSGWRPVEEVAEVAEVAAASRGRWARDDWFLVVSATGAPGLVDQAPTASGPVVTQYSLTVSPG